MSVLHGRFTFFASPERGRGWGEGVESKWRDSSQKEPKRKVKEKEEAVLHAKEKNSVKFQLFLEQPSCCSGSALVSQKVCSRKVPLEVRKVTCSLSWPG